ncbi:MAG: methyltransferase domain-containing protein [Sciscionella sp.]|nr:methyltransferase domain-containing protein [Sciscionella sp.]
MPTSASNPGRDDQQEPHRPQQQPHRHRQVAESFGVDAPRYDRARPRYPDELVRMIIDAGQHVEGRAPRVLDVGCGTGIAARQFQAAGCEVLGVEPDARMARFARSSGVDVEVVTFEDWEPAGRTFDVVFAATAWHWVDPVVGPGKAARVLRRGGVLVVFSHVFELPGELAESFAASYRRVAPDGPFAVDRASGRSAVRMYLAGYAKVAGDIRRAGGFAEPKQSRFDWRREFTRAQWLDVAPTTGVLTHLSASARARVLDDLGAAIDAMGGGFTMSSTTLALTAIRTESS